ncbi:MAG: glycosyltransferase family 4 protein [Armatimonadota bacterium]
MPPQIRLLHVLEATVGGTRRHVLDLCLGLPPERFRQHLVYSSLRSSQFEADAQQLRDAGIEVTSLPMRRQIEPVEDWVCLRQLASIISQWQPQIVHGHSAKGGFLSRLAARNLPGVCSLYNPHGFPFQMRSSPLKHRLYVALERYAARYTHGLIATCESQRALALEHNLLPDSRITVIPNGIRTEQFSLAVDRSALRRELGLPEQATVIGCIAALSPQKGVQFLLKAFPAVRRERPDAHLLLVGDGVLRPSLQRLANSLHVTEAVHFAGLRSDIPQILKALDLFVLPSLWEGLPYALLEAGAAGMPVVASDIPGNHDVIEHGVTGRLARPADASDLAAQIIAVLSDPATRTQAAALHHLIETRYTLAHMVSAHATLYEKLAAR